ncbi:MAG TPA: type IV pilin-like G/H family protein [Thermosynechococcaceae cyanobacterium]
MKSEFQAKLLQHMTQKKKQDEGFTLIELLVVIIIIGILAAIALPSFLNQANKAKESEAKQYVGSMNRTQQAYLLENNVFASEISLLGLGISTDTNNYTYKTERAGDGKSFATNVSYPKTTNLLRSHTGGVKVFTKTATQETTSTAILCQSKQPKAGATDGVVPGDAATEPTCKTPDYDTLAK